MPAGTGLWVGTCLGANRGSLGNSSRPSPIKTGERREWEAWVWGKQIKGREIRSGQGARSQGQGFPPREPGAKVLLPHPQLHIITASLSPQRHLSSTFLPFFIFIFIAHACTIWHVCGGQRPTSGVGSWRAPLPSSGSAASFTEPPHSPVPNIFFF